MEVVSDMRNFIAAWDVGLVLVLLYLGGGPVMALGAIWDSRARPSYVEVTIADGRVATGALAREWSSDTKYELSTAQGVLHFSDYSVMQYPPRAAESLWHSWRALLPPLCVLGFACIFPFVRVSTQMRRRGGA